MVALDKRKERGKKVIVKHKGTLKFLTQTLGGAKRSACWVSSDPQRKLPSIPDLIGAERDNCPLSLTPPSEPFAETIAVVTDRFLILFPAGKTSPLLLGSADDSGGGFEQSYPARGLGAAKNLDTQFCGLCVNPTWRDLVHFGLAGAPLLTAMTSSSFYVIQDEDTFHPDYFSILEKEGS